MAHTFGGFSGSPAPSAADKRHVWEALDGFDRAAAGERTMLFESALPALAAALAGRYRATHDAGWLALLLDVSDATAAMAAEDVASIVDAARGSAPHPRLLARMRADDVPQAIDPGFYVPVSTAGCTIVMTAVRYVVDPLGFPIFEGTLVLSDGATELARFDACTGSGAATFRITDGPLPPGRYVASNFRANRGIAGMTLNGVDFSVDLAPTDGTQVYGRSAFRIHPDGPPPGTYGCIGLRGSKAVLEHARDLLQRMVMGAGAKVAMQYVR